jgi:hypothetical protein
MGDFLNTILNAGPDFGSGSDDNDNSPGPPPRELTPEEHNIVNMWLSIICAIVATGVLIFSGYVIKDFLKTGKKWLKLFLVFGIMILLIGITIFLYYTHSQFLGSFIYVPIVYCVGMIGMMIILGLIWLFKTLHS